MNFKKILATLLAIVMVLGTTGVSFANDDLFFEIEEVAEEEMVELFAEEITETSTEAVAVLAGENKYLDDLTNAFTEEVNPNSKQVLLLKDWTGDVTIDRAAEHRLYLNGYTLNGKLTVKTASLMRLNGIDAGNASAGTASKIVSDEIAVENLSAANFHISYPMTIETTKADGVAIYSNDGKMYLENDGLVVNGAIESRGLSIMSITAGTYNGALKADGKINLTITGGKFSADPSAYVLPGSTVTKDADDMYTVTPPAAKLDDIAHDDEGNYFIKTADDVVTFRTLLNIDGSIPAGTNFLLANDIDMEGYTLTAVGANRIRFYGNFNGQNHAISNVVIDGGASAYVSFFGNVENSTIENLTLTNVSVTGTGGYTAALVGFARNSKINNCHINGKIEIIGGKSVGGFVGGAACDVTNSTIIGEEGSVIKGSEDVAGISGLASMGASTFTGNKVEGIDITAEEGIVGGLIGRVITTTSGINVTGNIIDDCKVVSAADTNKAGLAIGSTDAAAGEAVYTKNTFTDTTLTVNGKTANTIYCTLDHADIDHSENINKNVTSKASVNGVGYDSFAAAFAAADDGDTITLLEAVTLTEETTWEKKVKLNGESFATADMLTLADGASLEGANITGTVYTAANATVSVNIPNADLKTLGDITFKGDCVVKLFGHYYAGNTINIGTDATLEIMSGRIVLGYAATYNITGNITDAKTADKANIKPSLYMHGGGSITGTTGIDFNVINAYIKFDTYISSKPDVANGTFDFDITNSILESTKGKLAFFGGAADCVFNFNAKDSVLKIPNYLTFNETHTTAVFDNTNVDVTQLENFGTMTVKNGSVVNCVVASNQNATNPGTVIVDNATYSATGEFTSAAGTGNLIVRNNGKATVGSATKTAITVEAGSTLTAGNIKESAITVEAGSTLTAGDITDTAITVEAGSTLTAGNITDTAITVDGTSCLKAEQVLGTSTITIDTEVLNNGKVLDLNEGASREGKVSFTKPVASPAKVVYGVDGDVSIDAPLTVIDGVSYYDLKAALKAAYASKPAEINLYNDVVIDYGWDCRSYEGDKYCAATFDYPVTFNGNGHTIKFTDSLTDPNGPVAFKFNKDATVKNLTIDTSEISNNNYRAIACGACNLTVDNCHFIGNGAKNARGIIFGECGGADVSKVEISVTNCTFKDLTKGIIDNERGEDVKAVTVTGNTFENSNVNVSASETVTFSDNSVEDGYVVITSYAKENKLTVVAEDNDMEEAAEGSYIKAAKITTDGGFATTEAMIGGKAYLDINEAIKDAAAKATEEAPVTITLAPGTLELGTVMFPATVKNITIKGAEAADTVTLAAATAKTYETVLKNSNFFSQYGSNVDYQNITIEGIEFDNSYIHFTGGRASAVYRNWTIKDCYFHDVAGNTAVNFQLSDSTMTNFTFTGNIIENVTGNGKSGLYINNSNGKIVVKDNSITDVNWNAIQLNKVAENSDVTITGNTLQSYAEEGVLNLANAKSGIALADNTITTGEGQSAYAYFEAIPMGGKYYADLETAIACAKDGDVITLLENDTLSKATKITKDVTIDLAGYTLTMDAEPVEDIVDERDAAYYIAGDVTLKNGAVVISNETRLPNNHGNIFVETGASLTFDNVDLTTAGINSYALIQTYGNINYVNGTTVELEGKGRFMYSESYPTVTVANSEINITGTDGGFGPYLALDIDNSAIVMRDINGNAFRNVNATVTDSTVNVDGTENGIKNSAGNTFVIDGTSDVIITGADEYDLNLGDNDTVTVAAGASLHAESTNKTANVTGEGNIVSKADVVYVQFRQTDVDANGDDTLEGKNIYEIVLAGKDAEEIHELASADLTFVFDPTPLEDGEMSYFVTPAEGVSLSQTGKKGEEHRYMFNYDGVTKYEENGKAIVIGEITVEGYGDFKLSTDATAANAVYATEIRNNIVAGYTPAASLEVNKDMVADDGMVGEITNGKVEVPVRTLTINVTFPNSVKNNVAAYQNMTVKIAGGNVDKTIDLGTDYVDADTVYTATLNQKGTADAAAYEIKVDLPFNTAYMVTVEGDGYRTARYTVKLTEAKTLNFWNNVMDGDNMIEVEEDAEATATTKTFLAGDIVKDNQINVYDLSAVVSYFGKRVTVEEAPNYAKYDLDRNGVIDARDVAYVLVSWGE